MAWTSRSQAHVGIGISGKEGLQVCMCDCHSISSLYSRGSGLGGVGGQFGTLIRLSGPFKPRVECVGEYRQLTSRPHTL